MFNIVLYQPQIPQNTGNIARTCAVTSTKLHLIEPLGFKTDARAIKRAGLTYWPLVDVQTYANWEEFYHIHCEKNIFLFSSKVEQCYHEATFSDGDFLLFGREDAGVPREVAESVTAAYRIPMVPHQEARCLNLATSAGIILYEALRQTNFPHLI